MFEKHYLVKKAQYDDMIRDAEKARLVREIKQSHEEKREEAARNSRKEAAGLLERLALLFRDARPIAGN